MYVNFSGLMNWPVRLNGLYADGTVPRLRNAPPSPEHRVPGAAAGTETPGTSTAGTEGTVEGNLLWTNGKLK